MVGGAKFLEPSKREREINMILMMIVQLMWIVML